MSMTIVRVLRLTGLAVFCILAGLGIGKLGDPALADDVTTKEATEGYKIAKQTLLDLDYKGMARTLADNRRPLLPKSEQTDAAVAEKAEKLKASEEGIKKTQIVLSEVEALKPEFGAATIKETTIRNMKVTLVKIPLLGTRELAEKHRLGKGGWTGDGEGNLAVLMVKHEGSWYWNPFGW